jgi:hypothetical protein
LKEENGKAIATCEVALVSADTRLTKSHPLEMKVEALLPRLRDSEAMVLEVDGTGETTDEVDLHLVRRFKFVTKPHGSLLL